MNQRRKSESNGFTHQLSRLTTSQPSNVFTREQSGLVLPDIAVRSLKLTISDKSEEFAEKVRKHQSDTSPDAST
jgi:hypothetical protein